MMPILGITRYFAQQRLIDRAKDYSVDQLAGLARKSGRRTRDLYVAWGTANLNLDAENREGVSSEH
jgi:hypothetical protein